MVIAFDAASGDTAWNETGTNPQTRSHTITGSNPVVFVGVAMYDSSGAITSSSVKLGGAGGTPFTLVDRYSSNLESAYQTAELWYLDNPATGSQTIWVDVGGFSPDYLVIQIASYTGKTTTGLDAYAKAQNTSTSTSSPTCNVNVVHSDCWQIAFGYSRGVGITPTAGTGTTSRVANSFGHILGDSNGVVSTGNRTLAFNLSSAKTWPGVVSASFSAADASASFKSAWARGANQVIS